jgi:hypothetical protein
LKFYCAVFVLGPILLRSNFKFSGQINPQSVARETIPQDVRQLMDRHTPGIESLGFELVGYVRLGALTGQTQSFMALFSNSKTMEWADVSATKSDKQTKGYLEFITRCSDDSQVDTNTNATKPVLFPSPTYHVFRFPQITDAFTLHRAHRMLVQENLKRSRAELPAKGQELAELKRRLERYGVRQQERGYMYFDASKKCYRLTWKGAILGAWRSIWPISAVRNMLMRNESETRLRALGVGEVRTA